MITAGCDVGSLFTKAVVLIDDEPAASLVTRTTGKMAEETEELISSVLEKAGVKRGDLHGLAATGTGADLVKGADFVEDDLTCVAAASMFYVPEATLSIDVGGQSITSMLIGQEGEVTNFMRNDKCASGSGRFLEVMADKLGVHMDALDHVVSGSKRPVRISAQCGVFAESEVITHLNAGEALSDIMAGVCRSIANMVVAQARRFGEAGDFTVVGGVAGIEAVTATIREKLSGSFHPFPFQPGLAAAMGAALLVVPE